MLFSLKTALLSLCVLTLGAVLHADDFDLGKAGKLSVAISSKWTATTRPLGDVGLEISLQPKNKTNAKALISVFTPKSPLPPVTDAELDRKFTIVCQKFVPESVEQKVSLKPYKLQAGHGVYTLFTDALLVDKPSKPGDYKVMEPGIIKLNDSVQIMVTLFADDANGYELTAMRSAVESIRLVSLKP